MSFEDVVSNRTRGDEVVVGLLHGAPSNVTSIPFLEQCLGEDGPPTTHAALLAVMAAMDGVVLSALVAANALVLLCVALSKGPPLGSPARDVSRSSRRFVANLAAADATVGLASGYFLVFRYACGARAALAGRRWLCLSRFFLIAYGHLTSTTSMAAIAVDRYVAVCHALRYRHIMTSRRATLLLASCWILPALISCVQLFWNNWRADAPCEPETVLPVALVFGICGASHGVLLLVAGVTHYRIHRVAASLSSSLGSSNLRLHHPADDSSCPQAARDSSHAKTKSRVTKVTRTVFMVTGCYFVGWVPLMSLYVARLAGAKGFQVDVAYGILHTFANVSYLINPFIYALRNAEVRAAIMGMLKRLMDTKGGASAIRNFRVKTIRLSPLS